jgi:hypothetical protein
MSISIYWKGLVSSRIINLRKKGSLKRKRELLNGDYTKLAVEDGGFNPVDGP